MKHKEYLYSIHIKELTDKDPNCLNLIKQYSGYPVCGQTGIKLCWAAIENKPVSVNIHGNILPSGRTVFFYACSW